MTRRAGVLAALGALALAVPAEAARPRVVPARVQVVADEFTLTLSRLRVPSGPVIVELVNFGEDPHDLVLRRDAPGAPALRIRPVAPGKDARLRARLAPGRFRVWCSVGDHHERGMTATLRVVARR